MDAHLPELSSAAARLSELGAGHRAWFWFSPEANRLAVAPFKDRKGPARPDGLPPGARQISGLLVVGESGEITIATPLASRRSLDALSGWVRSHHEAQPGVRRLVGARLVRVGPDGTIGEAYADPHAWQGLAGVPCPGTQAFYARRLADLATGERASFWVAERGGTPFLAVASTAEELAAEVFQIRRRQPTRGPVVSGTLEKLGSVVALSTRSDLHQARELFTRLLSMAEGPPLSALVGAVLLRTGQEGAHQSVRLDRDEAAHIAALKSVRDGNRAFFWFGSSSLVLAQDAEVLKANKGVGGVTGQVRATREGWFEFMTFQGAPGFVDELAAWVEPRLERWPGLGLLRGARLSVRDRDGKIIERQQNAAAWR